MHVGWHDNHALMKRPVNPGLMLHLFILFCLASLSKCRASERRRGKDGLKKTNKNNQTGRQLLEYKLLVLLTRKESIDAKPALILNKIQY